MKLLATTMAVISLLATESSVALAQEITTGHEDRGDRVDVPDQGFGVSPPAGWTVEWTEQVAGSAESGLVLTAADTGQVCFAQSGPLDTVSFDELAAVIPDINEARQNTFTVAGPIAVELPAGPGVLFDVEQGPEPLSPAAQYLIDGGQRFLSVNCVGILRPADDWRSIAEAFEWIPLRREHHLGGVSITWPLDWSVTEYESPREWDGLIYGAMNAESMCTLADEGLFRVGGQDGRSLDTVVAAWRRAQRLGSEIEVPIVRPGVERAVRLDGETQSMYLLVSGDTIISLHCRAMPTSPEPPEDRWLSVAETFEFLPAEE